ncbi:MAG: starch-binding protein [Ruminococcus sp.]|nr:starch-binding protein [Ruminococcus sp.]
MKSIKKLIAAVLVVAVIASVAVFTSSAATTERNDTAAGGITVHYYCENGVPSIYYWNSLPTNIETTYPGVAMTRDTAMGNGWYKYSFADKTKINMLFVVNGVQSSELTRNTGEWWYKNNRWYSKDPSEVGNVDRTDMREDSIYFVITTRFYDGDKGNNVHCWDDKKANNPDSDPAWKGDFKGLIQKLDYIKALGFTAIWITPVVENASGYDYHGYHAFDFSKVDPRYESDGATLQDLIDAAHEKGMKIIQDVVWNHTGNFGETKLGQLFTKEYKTIQDLASVDSMVPVQGSEFMKTYPNYYSLDPDSQFQARLSILKNTDGKNHDVNNYYHHGKDLSWGSYTEQTGQIDGDCVDVNTENPEVVKYITDSYMQYVDMGVDAFRLDTEKHINRWTLNSAYFPVFNSVKNFFIFGEVCARTHDIVNEGGASNSPFFYTWKETDSPWTNNWSKTDQNANFENSVTHFGKYSSRDTNNKSTNAVLNGTTYHTPDYSKSNGTGVIDFRMHWAFENANNAYQKGIEEDSYFNDSTWNVVYVDSHDYAPDFCQKFRYTGGTDAWAENLDLMFTFRGIPCLYYGSEIEFQKGAEIDVGPNAPLSKTGRAYFGDNIEGTINATDFGKFTASGNAQTTLNKPLAKHIRQLNMIRRAIPALQKGQYATANGGMSFIRRYTAGGVDSLACVAISGGATFSGIPNGRYVDAVTGDVQNVSNGTLSVGSLGKGNMRVYVCCASGFTGINGKIGETGTYLK